MLAGCGSYDQLNIGGLACLEVISRRLQGIVDAHALSAQKPNWGLAKCYEGSGPGVDGVSEELKRYAARRARDDYELQAAQSRARDLRSDGGGYVAPTTGTGSGSAGDGAGGGGGGAGGPKGPKGGKGGGKGGAQGARNLAPGSEQ